MKKNDQFWAEEMERCKDSLYLYNNYWKVNGKPVKQLSREEWNVMTDSNAVHFRKRKGEFPAVALAQHIAMILDSKKVLMLCKSEDDPYILKVIKHAKQFIGKDKVMVTKEYVTEPYKRVYDGIIYDTEAAFHIEGGEKRFSGYSIQLKKL